VEPVVVLTNKLQTGFFLFFFNKNARGHPQMMSQPQGRGCEEFWYDSIEALKLKSLMIWDWVPKNFKNCVTLFMDDP